MVNIRARSGATISLAFGTRILYKKKKGSFQPVHGRRTALTGSFAKLDGFFKFFAGFKFHDIAGLDFNRFTSLRIAAFASFLAGF